MLRGNSREERRGQRDRRIDRRFGGPGPHRKVRPANDHTDDDRHDHRIEEIGADVKEGNRCGAGPDGRSQKDEGRRVVQEAFAFQYDDDSWRYAESFDDGRGDRVGRAEDGAQCQPGRKIDPGNHARHDPADRERGHDDEKDRQPADSGKVAAKLGDRHGDRGRIEQRRQDSGQNPLWVDLERRRRRPETDGDANEHEQQRCRHAHPRPKPGRCSDGQQRQHANGDRIHGTPRQSKWKSRQRTLPAGSLA